MICRESHPDAPSGEGCHKPEAVWAQAVKGLGTAEADVLEILDCCFASNIMKSLIENTRTYEVLAATGKDKLTPKPGPRSYTRALIDSLKDELRENEGRPFSTFDLNQKIHHKKNWEAAPHLYKIVGNAMTRHICLAPMDRPRALSIKLPVRNAGWLHLRVAFAEKSGLDENQVEKLARNLSGAAKKSKLGINAIDWMMFEPFKESDHFKSILQAARDTHLMLKYGKRMQHNTKRRREEGTPDDHQKLKQQHMSVPDVAQQVVKSRPNSALPTPGPSGPSSQGTTPSG